MSAGPILRAALDYVEKLEAEIKAQSKPAALEAVNLAWQHFDPIIYDMFQQATADFYGSYKPRFYTRQRRLENIFASNIDGASYTIYEDEGALAHESLFSTVYLFGWHGGATGPTGLPQYRKPYPTFKHWGRVAERSESVHDIFWKQYYELRRGAIMPFIEKKFIECLKKRCSFL